MKNLCPCCGRTSRGSVKSKLSAGEKKHQEDQTRCLKAIDVLQNFNVSNIEYQESGKTALAGAMALELDRMVRAYDDPVLLWSIYRRKDKGTGYRLVQEVKSNVEVAA